MQYLDTYSDDYLAILRKEKDKIEQIVDSESSTCLKALGYVRLGKLAEAKTLLASVTVDSLIGDEKRYYLETKLLIYWRENNHNMMLSCAHEIIKEFPDSYFANNYLGFLLKISRNWKEAYSSFENCLIYFPNDERVNFEALSLAVKLKYKKKIPLYRAKIKTSSRKIAFVLGTNLIIQLLFCVISLYILFVLGRFTIHVDIWLYLLVVLFWVKSLKERNIFYSRFLGIIGLISFSYFIYRLVLFWI